MRSFKSISIICIILFSIFSAIADKVTDNDITIESDKSIYYCQPIYNTKGECIIKAKLTIINDKSNGDYKIKTTYSTEVGTTEFYLKEKFDSKTNITTFKEKTKIVKDEKSGTTINVKKGEGLVLDVEFFTLANGKFNVSVSDGIVTTTLDPFYNITINSVVPSYWLKNGFALESSIYNYTTQTDISTGLSDGNPSTNYQITLGSPLYQSDMSFYYPMNCLVSHASCDNSPVNNPIYVLPNAYFVNSTDPYLFRELNISASASSGAEASWKSQYQIGAESFTYCARVTQTTTGSARYVMSAFDTTGSGYGIYFDNSNRPHCVAKDDNSAEIDLSLATAIALNNPVTICCRRNITDQKFSGFINSTLAATNTGSVETLITHYSDIKIGTRTGFGAGNFVGQVDEVVMWKKLLTNEEIAQVASKGASFRETGHTIQPFFNHSLMTNESQYYLYVKTPTTFPFRIYAMLNSTHINPTKMIEQQVYGDTYIPLNNITSVGYNNPFRIFNMYQSNASIEDIYLIENFNDSTAPNIYDCGVNDSVIDCDDGITWYCRISDDGQVLNATGVVEFAGAFNLSRTAVKAENDTDLYEVKLTALETSLLLASQGWTFNTSANARLVQVKAQDLGGNIATNTTDLAVNNTYACILTPPCIENWVAYYTPCQFNDTQTKYYIDEQYCGTYDLLPGDNNTETLCNYCSQDIQKQYNGSCFLNGTSELINYYYIDNEYYSCCAITGLISDCGILYEPYNSSYYESCVVLNNQFEVDYDDTCEFDLKTNDKCYWKIHLNGTTGEYKCVTYVRTSLDKLIQTNPPYTAKSDTFITLKGTEYEDRSYFTTASGLANVYFTKENLIFDDRSYIFSVECSNGTNIYQVDKQVKVEYANMNSPITRMPFLANNANAIVAMIIGIMLVLLIIFALWRFAR